jgi:(2Fe-2S) ferredoxin
VHARNSHFNKIFIINVNSHFRCITHQHASDMNHSCFIKINRSVCMKIAEFELNDCTRNSEIIYIHIDCENISEVVKSKIDV